MTCRKCKLFSPIRWLLPFAAVLFALPFIFKENLMFATVPLFYFLGVYFILLNFPKITESLNKKPLYIEDLKDEIYGYNQKFYKAYVVLMNFMLAAVFSGLAEYIIVKGVRNKPVAEIFAVIGGNISLYLKIQNSGSKIILKICNCCKNYVIKHPVNIDMADEENQIELVEL